MKFLDINTGYSFDGLWNNSQSKGYIFWFPNEQSTYITHSMPICIITETSNPLSLTIENNNVFNFITHTSEEIELDCCTFNTPEYSLEYTTSPVEINGKYIHVANVTAKSENVGEFICKINIGNEGFIRVGADFYGEYEPYDVNLSNFGVEIPDTIQKAIYDSNIHEDYKDNILMNRKYKELLSNYWDIVANRGSYKSLKNSLDWFEWGDILEVKEIWKRDEAGKVMFDDREIMSLFEDKISDSFSNFSKTAYISLFSSVYSDGDTYDSEGNPELVENVFKWAKNDIRIKLSLLTQFFGAYFLPIHMSVLYATLEDRVYTNTIKALSGSLSSRYDIFGDFNFAESNIKDNSIFKLGNVKSCINKSTKFYHETGFGVSKMNQPIGVDIDKFASQYYVGPGAIIPIEIIIPNQQNKDFIKKTIVDFDDRHIEMYDQFKTKNNKIEIKFNFLAKEAKEYDINMTFLLASGKTITKKLYFIVEDVDNLILNIYKVQAKDDSKGFTYNDFANMTNAKYFFSIQKSGATSLGYYMQYLPYMYPDNIHFEEYKGIKLNRTVIIEFDNATKYDLVNIRNWFKDYLEFQRRDTNTGELKYLIFVSKKFYEELPKQIYEHPEYKVIKNDLVFYHQFHNLVKMTGTKESNYTVSQYEAVCVSPEISVDRRTSIPFRYGHNLTSTEWTFTNASTNEIIEHPASSNQPFVVKSNSLIRPGYYNISFKYSLSDGFEGECKLDSAFRIKTI